MARQTPVMYLIGGPLHGMQRDKNTGGRWPVYLDTRLGPDGELQPIRTSEGDSRARKRADDEPVTFYKLTPDEVRSDGRYGREYAHCTVLEERARRAARAADAEAAALIPPAPAAATASTFVEPSV